MEITGKMSEALRPDDVSATAEFGIPSIPVDRALLESDAAVRLGRFGGAEALSHARGAREESVAAVASGEAACERLARPSAVLSEAEAKLQQILEADTERFRGWAESGGEGEGPVADVDRISEATIARDIAAASAESAGRAMLPIATRLQADKAALASREGAVQLAAIVSLEDQAREALETFVQKLTEAQNHAAMIQELALIAVDSARELGGSDLGRLTAKFGSDILAELIRLRDLSISTASLTFADSREVARQHWLEQIAKLKSEGTAND